MTRITRLFGLVSVSLLFGGDFAQAEQPATPQHVPSSPSKPNPNFTRNEDVVYGRRDPADRRPG